jgi:hypothetical protein
MLIVDKMEVTDDTIEECDKTSLPKCVFATSVTGVHFQDSG